MSGSTKVRTLRYQPIAKPTGTATSTPRKTPMKTRRVDIQTSRPSRSRASSTNLASTACGAGTSDGLTSPLARTAYQSATMASQGAAIRAARLRGLCACGCKVTNVLSTIPL